MLNIFNLFLFLLLLWIALMLSSAHVNMIYLLLGILSCGLTAIGCAKLNLINKNTEFLYLSLGFYRHFIKLYFSNFFKSLGVILKLSLSTKPIRPLVYSVVIEYKDKFNPALMDSTLIMLAGLFCIGMQDETFFIHALDEKYFEVIDFYKIRKILPQVNDDNLV